MPHIVESPRRAVLIANWRVTLQLAVFAVKIIRNSGACHAKFHTDLWHRRRIICPRTYAHKNKCVSKTHIDKKRGRNTPSPCFRGSIFFSHCIYSTQGIENDVSASFPNITSASCDLDLWPPDPWGRPFMSLPRGKIYAAICIEIVHSSSKYSVHKLVTDERPNGRRHRSRTLCIRPLYRLAYANKYRI